MKVCMLTTSFPRFAGDYAGNFVHALATEIRNEGVEVVVVAPGEAGVPKREFQDGLTVHRFTYMVPERWQRIAYLGGIPSNLRSYPFAWVQLPLFCLSFFVQGLRSCRDCDVIHAHWIFSGLVGLLVAVIYRKPIVLTVHGSDVNLLPQNGFLRQLRFQVIKRMDRIIAVSRPLLEKTRSLGADERATVLIPNGVDVSVFSCPPKCDFDYRLLWMGRMNPEKGLESLVRALPSVLASFPQATLTLIGDGPLRQDIEELVTALNLGGQVYFTGRIPYGDVPAYLAQTDVFVLPSLSEGLPLALLEAMSAGKPVVASKVGGIPDMVVTGGESRNGHLVPTGNPEALGKAILTLFADPEAARQMGRNGRTRITTHCTWTAVAQETVHVYHSVVP